VISLQRLDLQPIVKYSALEFFAGRFLPALPRWSIILRSFGESGGRLFLFPGLVASGSWCSAAREDEPWGPGSSSLWGTATWSSSRSSRCGSPARWDIASLSLIERSVLALLANGGYLAFLRAILRSDPRF
jgi:hypothetical protein